MAERLVSEESGQPAKPMQSAARSKLTDTHRAMASLLTTSRRETQYD
jgi:hypothetical protein